MSDKYPTCRIETAFADPDLLHRLAIAHSPYPAPRSGYNDPPQASKLPWFKAVWATAEPPIPEMEQIFCNPYLMAAAGELFEAKVIRPDRVLANLMGPMPALSPHLDPSTFRGQDTWVSAGSGKSSRFAGSRALAGLMATSGLFERWRVRSATAVMWFYNGSGGEYRYWPNGPQGPSEAVYPPFGNSALLGDNNLMFHGIGDVGSPDQYLAPGTVRRDTELSYTDGGRWVIADQDGVRASYADDDIRISVVWKANCFADDAEALMFDEHTDDIELSRVVEIFSADLRAREVRFTEPTDPLADHTWFRTLIGSYGFAKPSMQDLHSSTGARNG